VGLLDAGGSPRISEDAGYTSQPASLPGDVRTSLDLLLGDISLSLCGGLDTVANEAPDGFNENLLAFEEFSGRPDCLFDRRMVAKIGQRYYNWRIAAPMLASVIVFHQPLTEDAISALAESARASELLAEDGATPTRASFVSAVELLPVHRRESDKCSSQSGASPYDASGPLSISTDTGFPTTQDRSHEGVHTVYAAAAGSSSTLLQPTHAALLPVPALSPSMEPTGTTSVDGNCDSGSPLVAPQAGIVAAASSSNATELQRSKSSTGMTSWFSWSRRAASAEPAQPPQEKDSLDRSATPGLAATKTPIMEYDTSSGPANYFRIEALKDATSTLSSDTDSEIAGYTANKQQSEDRRYRKTLRLTSDQLKRLNLREGRNEARFSVTTKYQGTTYCTCDIYLWSWDDKLVISDIDGTITKSDVMGQLAPFVGGQWAQPGVTKLYNRISANGYRIVYLSARAIGQSSVTKDYLRSVNLDGLNLPDGPVLLSPSSLLVAFHREVIEKKPEEFKKSCLSDIRSLFPNQHFPFSAGFGNKINDVWAYRAVGIASSRIFSINHRGELRHEFQHKFSSTYMKVADELADHLFPPLHRNHTRSRPLSTDFEHGAEYSRFTFWRTPMIDISLAPPVSTQSATHGAASTVSTISATNASSASSILTSSTTTMTSSTGPSQAPSGTSVSAGSAPKRSVTGGLILTVEGERGNVEGSAAGEDKTTADHDEGEEAAASSESVGQ
jgi:hypothetical protein